MTETRKPVAIRLSEAERNSMSEVAKSNAETLTGWMRRVLVAAVKQAKKEK